MLGAPASISQTFMPQPRPQPRLLFALIVSLCFHLLLIAIGALSLPRHRAAPAPIEARLSPAVAHADADAESVLKNTLDETAKKEPARPPPLDPIGRAPEASLRAAQRKLSAYQFYPAEAAALGIEGEVRLLLTLDMNGILIDIRVASSSGYPVLDDAAVRAAAAMHSVPNAGAMEMILPVVFRLE
jgi:protein TonB